MTPRPARLPALALVVLIAALAAVLTSSGTAPAGSSAARPNVVVVMTDDQTLADLDAMPQTRSLIGGQGATFTRSYVSYPLCCPSRATFLTGRYAHNHGVRNNVPPHGGYEALDGKHTLPVWLEDAGYDTIHIGKYLNGYGLHRAATVPPGWTDWHGTVDKSTYQMWGYRLSENGEVNTYGRFRSEDPELYQTDVLGEKAIRAIQQHRDEDARPFFLSVAFVAPHGEVTTPGGTTTPYIRPAPAHRGWFSVLPLPASPAYDEADVSDKPPFLRRSTVSAASRRHILRDFRSRRESLLAVDEAVAGIVAALRETGKLSHTYIVFTSDNGFMEGQHRIPKGKYVAYDASSHVPLLVRGPGIPAGQVTDELVANSDLAPTVLDMAGASADRVTDGRSLLPFAEDPARRSSRPILHEGLVGGDADRDGALRANHTSLRPYFAVRTRRYLYVKWRGGARELYDLALDPFELESRTFDPRYAIVKARLSHEVARLRLCQGADCRAPFPEPPPPSPLRARRSG